ncbi:MAG TPA: hypothetical protein VM187_10785 [Niastella sp.]|nr:hypothetical protein [Niastella sp.]
MKLAQRIKAPTPAFFKKVRNIGLALAGISTAVLAAPIALPAILIQLAGYLAVAGGIATAISQAATEEDQKATKRGGLHNQ